MGSSTPSSTRARRLVTEHLKRRTGVLDIGLIQLSEQLATRERLTSAAPVGPPGEVRPDRNAVCLCERVPTHPHAANQAETA